MCTCIAYRNGNHYFGRNLDLDHSFQERIMVTPRRYAMHFCHTPQMEQHYAMAGMAAGVRKFPLYADAVNEAGLAMAGLYFPGNAYYGRPRKDKDNIASFEVIPWILGQCRNIEEVKKVTSKMHITNDLFDSSMPAAPLHWMISDLHQSLVLEPMKEGLKVYDNPYEVLTNNPPFPYHMARMQEMLNLTSEYPKNRFSDKILLEPYGEGMGALGLPGDSSPTSRFLRTSFLKFHSVSEKDTMSELIQVFHILAQVGMVRGSVCTEDGGYDLTRYTCCIDQRELIYYYKTYSNFHVQALDIKRSDLDSSQMQIYKLSKEHRIFFHN